ncbi:MAG: transglutaminase-like domain-containing protein [Oscillospiraceae bacterium]|nr:transglutaminase-like domain-containing protein [Oscillospiraceae bacterium]
MLKQCRTLLAIMLRNETITFCNKVAKQFHCSKSACFSSADSRQPKHLHNIKPYKTQAFCCGLIITAVLFLNACDFVEELLQSEQSGQLEQPEQPSKPEFDERTIVESVGELDAKIAEMTGQFQRSANVLIRNVEIWQQLSGFYEDNQHLLVLRGIRGMDIEFLLREDGVLDAVITPEYEMFKNILIAYENDDTSHLTTQEIQVYEIAQSAVATYRGNTTFETAHALHTFVKNSMEFEHNHENNPNAFNVYGALVEGRAVCQGYAQSLLILLHMAGIENTLITGQAGDEEHAWNFVNYGTATNPNWYHVDVTWNDTEHGLSNQFFNVSDAVIQRTHTWERANFPPATSMQRNYFKFNAIVANNPEQLEAIFVNLHNQERTFIEILCTFDVSPEHLTFLHRYSVAPEFKSSIYGEDVLLTVVL